MQLKFLSDVKNSKVEDAFKAKNKLGFYLLLSMFFTFVFGLLGALLIFPAVIFFANYCLVFDIAGKQDLGLFESLKQAKETAKGYRGKLAWLCVIFMFILLLLVGFCMLCFWLVSLFTPALATNANFILSFIQIPYFYYIGAFAGVSLFLIFVLPVELVCVANVSKAIEQDKLYLKKNAEVEAEAKNKDSDGKDKEKKDIEEENKQEKNDEPSNYIF